MGMKAVRASRKNHPIPIESNPQRKGRYMGAPKVADDLKVPMKHRPFEVYPTTPPPMDAEEPVRGEGKLRARKPSTGKP